MADSDLDFADIQSVVHGYPKERWRHARFVYVNFSAPKPNKPNKGCAFLKELNKTQKPWSITSLRNSQDSTQVAYNIAFTYRGMQKLQVHPDILASFPEDLRQGMRNRAAQIGDDIGDWEKIWKKNRVDAIIAIYGNKRKQVKDFHKVVKAAARKAQMAWRSVSAKQDAKRILAKASSPVTLGEDESHQPPRGTLLEHFGFADGITSPAVRGLSHRDPRGNGKLEDGDWQPLATGEFLLGHTDEVGEIPIAPKPDRLAHNGTFLVYRKLEQDVDAFRKYVINVAAENPIRLDDGSVIAQNPDYVAAKMVGRRRDGSNLVDRWRENDFRFEHDPDGNYCPLGAHIRRVNPRDSMGFESRLVNRHRMIRRSITYGDLIPSDQPVPQGDAERGLIFVTLAADITRQFEFIQQQWVNFGNDLEQGDDMDPVVGPHDGHGKMVIPQDGDTGTPPIICAELKRFVTSRGGNYFFLPGLRAYDGIVDGEFADTVV